MTSGWRLYVGICFVGASKINVLYWWGAADPPSSSLRTSSGTHLVPAIFLL